ncbi:uncharacterized protein SCHCODRAFT_02737780 [Schizophyllum commune H4-8]|uniref:uncharacterized protein n=1 Tax=Schizophyllum commune (strain H4-8 / FGSC 9210) TaxID=578458 RepID=UPI00215DD571|nr:uncharacterized protein SCHCODRAFT_02737780 [Schizophyllum commune H4-8]KAI5890497.1 hypothetical protein SCHCODRAFT_02737780 [Schizophyllum commune H4-8]
MGRCKASAEVPRCLRPSAYPLSTHNTQEICPQTIEGRYKKSFFVFARAPPMALATSAAFMYLPIPFVMAARPPRAVRVLLFAAQVMCANWATTTLAALDDTFITNVMGCMLYGMPIFMASDYYFLTDPLSDGTRHLYDKQAAKDMPFLQRLWWSLCFFLSLRGVGWNKPVPHLRKIPRDQTRASYLVEHSFWLGIYVVVSDFANWYFSHNPITSSRVAEGFPLTSQGPIFQALSSCVFWSNAWAGFNICYELFALMAVGLGLWEPQAWPPMFGSIGDLSTVRRTWGRFWHCILRRFIVSHGKWVAKAIGAKPGTKASSYAQLYTAFFISGIIHEAGARHLNTTFGRCMCFFMLQAICDASALADATCSTFTSRGGIFLWSSLRFSWFLMTRIYTP